MSDTSTVVYVPHKCSAYSYFKKALRSLRLDEFPCGAGSWRNSKLKHPEDKFVITGKDYGAQYEKVEQLLEYLNTENWKSDTSWSKEADDLKKLAILNPWKFEHEQKRLDFIHTFIKSLQFRDKNIDHIDKKILNFVNLEELVLTANFLSQIHSKHLPPKLQVLELGGNFLSSISSLCKHPPPLLHLGISHNQLTSLSECKFFTSVYWPHLKSLDLSHNNLSSVVPIIDSIRSLTELKSLNLIGNPLSLVPSYRGFIIDSLKDLTYLDDVIVSPDEKHYFRGLGKKKDLMKDESYLTITMAGLYGLPIPYEHQQIEKPDYPVVSTQYFVSYKMLNETSEEPCQIMPIVDTTNNINVDLTDYQTEYKEWGTKVIDLSYKNLHTSNELLKLRDFLKHGIKLSLFSKIVKSWPAKDEQGDDSNKSSEQSGQRSSGRRSTDKRSGRESSQSKRKDKKSKKEPVELKESPPEYHLIGSYVIDSNRFLTEQVNEINKICYCGGGPLPPSAQLKDLVNLHPVEPPKPEKTSTSEKDKKGSKKSKKSNKSKSPVEVKEEPPEPPILIDVNVTLRRWNTAADCHKYA